MKNYKVFILCSASYLGWHLPCRNVERHVESARFFKEHFPEEEYVCGCITESPRKVLTPMDGKFRRWWKLRHAVLLCRYVYPVAGWDSDREARSLKRFAKITFKKFIEE